MHMLQSSWTGSSGTTYTFDYTQLSMMFRSVGNSPDIPTVPGVYIFARNTSSHVEFEAIYIGQSKNLHRRLIDDWNGGGHDARECIELEQPTTLHILITSEPGSKFLFSEDVRRKEIEGDLIVGYDPPCNRDR